MDKVTTVTGPIEADKLGRVLPHEHVFINTVREYRGAGLVNDEALMVEELKRYREGGGTTLVDLSLVEIGRDPAGLKRASEKSGVQIIMGCGHYRDPYLDRDWFDRTSVDEIAAEMIDEIENGVGDTGVKPGIIGEIGADQWYVSAAEERSFRAAARTHHATGLTITTHAARWPVGRDQLAILKHEGVDPRRVIIGHCESVPLPDYHVEMAAEGCFVAFDGVGTGTEWDTKAAAGYVKNVIDAGYADHVLLSHDVFLRGHMRADGGCGYTFIYETFVPMLTELGIDEAQIERFFVDNARAALTGERAS